MLINHNGASQRQSSPAALAHLFCGEERLKNTALNFLWNAPPGVADCHHRPVSISFPLDLRLHAYSPLIASSPNYIADRVRRIQL
jgi:hypothetical protein